MQALLATVAFPGTPLPKWTRVGLANVIILWQHQTFFMKKMLTLTAFFVLICAIACKKTGGGGGTGGTQPPGGGHAKKWLIKSVVGKYSETQWSHVSITYNDTGRILRMDYGLTGLNDTFGQASLRFAEYTYDSATGRVTFMKPLQEPGIKYVYLNANSIQVYPEPYYPKTDGYGIYNFNGHSRNELDDIIAYIPPGQIGAGTTTTGFVYNDIGGLQGQNTLDDKGVSQDIWAFVSPGPAKSIPNPFAGMSVDQKIVYYTNHYGLLSPIDMMGETWSNGVIQFYTYRSGSKRVLSYFENNYELNADSLVTKVTPAVKLDSPSFSGPWQLRPSYYITYEKH